ncbi:MAG: LysR family transcriptional regulator ArgP [Pseudomonadaceae bacterium]|nr:MAG: LysR family transcriptional regulator ArgP [Pseudomonadaceae bacterium]
MLDYRLLAALAAVIEEGSFERAAQRLCITQSAVSQRIKQLESRLGQAALLRSSPPQPTTFGRQLHNHLRQVEQMEQQLGLGDPLEAVPIRLTVNADSLATWLPAALSLPDYPGVRYHLSVEDQAVGLRRMKNGEVMACLCASADAVNGGRVEFLGLLRYRAVATSAFVAHHQALASKGHWLSRAPCLVFNQDDRLQHDYLASQGAGSPQHCHYCPSSEGFVQCVEQGMAFGLIPELQIRQQLASGSLIEVLPDTPVDVPLYWHYWRAESAVLKTLRLSVREAAQQVLQR